MYEFLYQFLHIFFNFQPLANNTNLLPEEMINSTLYKEPVDPAKWFGIRKDATALGYSKVYSVYTSQPVKLSEHTHKARVSLPAVFHKYELR